MTEALQTPQTEETPAEHQDIFGQVGLEGVIEVLRLKLKREQEVQELLSPEERARIAISKIEDPRSRQALNGDIENVIRVMTAVDSIRAIATEERPVRDRDIYIAYRRIAETESPDPRFVHASQVLINFMGGQISGHLPF